MDSGFGVAGSLTTIDGGVGILVGADSGVVPFALVRLPDTCNPGFAQALDGRYELGLCSSSDADLKSGRSTLSPTLRPENYFAPRR
ncbi:MAG: hypothetical protein JF615_02725 [Asticcacaulis sp.]|nr:hypothetical protein [Asticcacaulis sp.]